MGKRLHQELEVAFSSAKTKYPSLDDIISGIEDREERKSKVEDHLLHLSMEMEEDSTSIEFSTAVRGFVRKKLAKRVRRYNISI